MKNKVLKIVTIVVTLLSLVLPSIPAIAAETSVQNNTTITKNKNKQESKSKSKSEELGKDSVVETKTVQEKAAEDKTAGTNSHTGVMGYMYAKNILNLDITNKRAVQSSSVTTIANRTNSVLDTSEWQGNFTDSQVKNLKKQHKFIILRVQYGSNYKDKTFAHNVALMNKYGMKYGVYSFSQYINPKDAAQEARDLYNRAPKASFYVNDYEDQTVTSGGTNASTQAWLTEMKKHSGNKKVLFYSYYWFMKDNAETAMKKYDGFWLAAYQSSDPTTATHQLWQYTNSYRSSALGQNVDASVATSKSLDWFLNTTSTNSGPQGPAIKTSKDIYIKKNYNLWADFKFNKVKNKTDNMLGKILHVKVYYEHNNGNTYYSAYDSNNKWLGYINKDATQEVSQEKLNKNISINNRNQNLWSNFVYSKVQNKSSKYYDGNINLIAKIKYTGINGASYYSLYDKDNNWQGYVNTKFVTELKANEYNRKVTITKKVPIWNSLFWKQKATSSIGKEYDAKYIYNTGNGKSYLSLYNGNTWIGYINKNATKSSSPVGNPIKVQKTIFLKKKNVTIWNDFKFLKKRGTSNKLLGKVLYVKVIYKHDNGFTYYSLYDSKGTWIGYVNNNALSVIGKSSLNQNVSINNRNQKLWSNFVYSKVQNKSSKYYDGNINLIAKIKYTGINGASYYSLYDKDNNWQGYINTKFVSDLSAKKYNRQVTVIKKYPIWKNLFWKKSATAKIGNKYTAKYVYTTGNGKKYLSLYNGNNWIGYVNEITIK